MVELVVPSIVYEKEDADCEPENRIQGEAMQALV